MDTIELTGWDKDFRTQSNQMGLVEEMYSKNGFEIKLTCFACPEQYDVFKDGKQVAYYRLRHGGFTVESPDCGGYMIYEAEPDGDGIFEEYERLVYLEKAMQKLILYLCN